MPRVELAASAVEDLRTLIRTHSLPADTTSRVVKSLRPLERFPLLGPALTGRWEGFRFVLGPGAGCCSSTSCSSPAIAWSW